MISPKEKAEWLVDRYCQLLMIRRYEDKTLAKNCALIAVDEIIKTLNPPCLNEFSYWQEVKNEIELL